MSVGEIGLLRDLEARGLVAQMTGDDQLYEHLAQPRTLYSGFDPTADSLHIGHLVPLIALRRFQLSGHTPIALVGGATGLIGDPSFKAAERQLNTQEVVSGWVDRLKSQIAHFLDFDAGAASAQVVNNIDWVGDMNVLAFLRDVGKHFSVSNMINKESVKQRLNRDGAGISFTEFTYMLLQSYDFAELYRRYGCTLQVGGSDQWGNITGGVDLTRRLHAGQAYGLTLPLVTKADGTKFGKTEAGAVWLDSAKTSPYAFYQFWLNTADADAYRFLRYFTFLPVARIAEIEQADASVQGRPEGQRVLAEEVTKLVHGNNGLVAAQRITQAMFSGDLQSLAESDFMQLRQDGLPASELRLAEERDKPLTTLLSECGMVTAGREVKDALSRGAVWINGEAKSSADNARTLENFSAERAFFGRYFVVRVGKKKNHLFELG